MTTAHHVLALIRSHIHGDGQRFMAVARAIAGDARAAKHGKLASDIESMLAEANNLVQPGPPLPMAPSLGPGLEALVKASRPDVKLADLVLSEELARRLDKVIREFGASERLAAKGLTPRRKFLLSGPPGTGKGMTARALAGTLDMPLYTIMLDGVITKFMGETATKLRLVFDAMVKTPGVYFFDEIDALAASRDHTNDVGEARRMLNSFLMLLEGDQSGSLIVAATNHRTLLDRALFRRFDAAFAYGLPSQESARRVIVNRLAAFDHVDIDWDTVLEASAGLSQNELVSASEDAARECVLDSGGLLSTDVLARALRDRSQAAATA